jgi:hypothetical protein
MVINHRIMRIVVALSIGFLVSYGSFQWLTDAERPERRAEEEGVVNASRAILLSYIDSDDIAVSDALDRVREAGKVYVFPTERGWELSGHYQRAEEKIWHDFLMRLDKDLRLESLSVNDDDARLQALAQSDPLFSTAN